MKSKIDFSRFPELNEKDLKETHVRGDGPGGQATNKTNNCVVLLHIPTNISVKCHETRYLEQNRKEARRLLVNKLDEFYNKENSVENQLKRLEKAKSLKQQSKNEKLRKIKLEFKLKVEAEKNKNEFS
jgi:peptide chain release factor